MTDMNDPFDTPRDTDRRARRAARAKGGRSMRAADLLGQPTLRPIQKLDGPAAGDSDALLLIDAVTAAKLLGIANGEGGAI